MKDAKNFDKEAFKKRLYQFILVFLQHCLKSANESKVWLAILRDSGRANREKANQFLAELGEFSSIFASSILTIKGKKTI